MDEQKWSSCSWLLLQEFVKIYREQEKERQEAIARGELNPEELGELPLPSMPWVSSIQPSKYTFFDHVQYKARQVMTRADFMEGTHPTVTVIFQPDSHFRQTSTAPILLPLTSVLESSI